MKHTLHLDDNKASVLYLATTEMLDQCKNELIIADALIQNIGNGLPSNFKNLQELTDHIQTQTFLLENLTELSSDLQNIIKKQSSGQGIPKPKWGNKGDYS